MFPNTPLQTVDSPSSLTWYVNFGCGTCFVRISVVYSGSQQSVILTYSLLTSSLIQCHWMSMSLLLLWNLEFQWSPLDCTLQHLYEYIWHSLPGVWWSPLDCTLQYFYEYMTQSSWSPVESTGLHTSTSLWIYMAQSTWSPVESSELLSLSLDFSSLILSLVESSQSAGVQLDYVEERKVLPSTPDM